MQRFMHGVAAMALLGALGFGGAPVRAQTFTTLYSFTGGADGYIPYAGVILDKKGNLYGTTSYGGSTGNGVVFKLDKKGNETVLYTFSGGTDGGAGFPSPGSLIMDKHGNLYGTTPLGGARPDATGYGVVYKLSPPYGQNNETVLYTFTGGADGGQPYAGVILDKQGDLYGTAASGGAYNAGVVFKLSPPYGQNSETVLYSFTGGADGLEPVAGVIMDKNGNLYGTTAGGGDESQQATGYGVVFKLSPPSNGSAPWNENVLYTFSGGADGREPEYGSLIMDQQGNLYGTTTFGTGANGVVFKLSPPSSGSTPWNETVLCSFTRGTDGALPVAGVIMDKNGNLYGTTSEGGASGVGVVFKVDPSGNETVLYTFTGGADGSVPWAGVIMDKKGNLYGTTLGGGTGNGGVVYKLTP